jgi:hypothetical protein
VEVAVRLHADQNYTLVLHEDPAKTLLLSDDNTWPDVRQIRLRWVNLTGDSAIVSSKAISLGAAAATSTQADGLPTLTHISSRSITPYLIYNQATFDGRINDPRQRMPELALDKQAFLGGAVYSVFVFNDSTRFTAAISIDARALLLPETGEALDADASYAFKNTASPPLPPTGLLPVPTFQSYSEVRP